MEATRAETLLLNLLPLLGGLLESTAQPACRTALSDVTANRAGLESLESPPEQSGETQEQTPWFQLRDRCVCTEPCPQEAGHLDPEL